MQVKEIMTSDPVCCTPDSRVREAARMMVEHDCGAIPVVEKEESGKPVGLITDRDIVCRIVAEGKNPIELTIRECMTRETVSVRPEASLEECCALMEKRQLRRMLVVDQDGRVCGIVSQADVARRADGQQTAEVVKEVSKPAGGKAGEKMTAGTAPRM